MSFSGEFVSVGADLARLLIGAILLTAGISKVLAIEDFTRILGTNGLVPARIARGMGFVVPITEILLGAWLVVGEPGTTFAAAIAAALFLGFAIVIGKSLRRGRSIVCGCFGKLSGRRATWSTVVRNVASSLLAVSVAISTNFSAPTFGTGWPTLFTMIAVVVGLYLVLEFVHTASLAMRGGAR